MVIMVIGSRLRGSVRNNPSGSPQGEAIITIICCYERVREKSP
jgi:hypothetical protein